MKKNQQGITIVHVLLGIVLVGAAGFAGWRVYESKQSKTNSAADTVVSEQKETAKTPENIPAGFVIYENKELGFSFAYPENWGEVKTAYITTGTPHFSLAFSKVAYDPKLTETSSELALSGITGNDYATDGWYKFLAAGFDKKGDLYFDKAGEGSIPEAERQIKDTVTIVGRAGDGIAVLRHETPGGLQSENHYVGFNLKSNQKNVSGVRFWFIEREGSIVKPVDFDTMLSTFKLI